MYRKAIEVDPNYPQISQVYSALGKSLEYANRV